jgi:phage shock protein PspC (stress-responsive transcriptional regulator)
MTDQAVPPPAPPGSPPPPPGNQPPPPTGPPPAPDGPTWSRENLIRPRQGRYIAGVSGAIARATNTDPVLWRVVLAVLGVFGGVGVLVYLLGWLLIPAEGDTASPIESLLGRGRSGMAPLSVVLLTAAAIVVFAFVVNDGFRAALLAAAVLIGGVLILRRNGRLSATAPAPPAAENAPWPAAEQTATWPTAEQTTAWPAAEQAEQAEQAGQAEQAAAWPAAGQTAPAGEKVAEEKAGEQPTVVVPPLDDPVAAGPLPPRWEPPVGGYRPPFAPHGPWAQQADRPPYETPVAPPAAPRPPKPPRERSKLGRITFFGLVVVVGVLAALDTSGTSVPVSAYFAAALATIALGLVVGAWFGRARGLIALAVLASIGLGISSGIENFGGKVANSNYRPQTFGALADRYDFTIGNATLDLRALDFSKQTEAQTVTIAMRVGQVRVLLPDEVDTSVSVDMDGGRASLFGQDHDGKDLGTQEITDLGADGKGGGTLRLAVQMDAGNVEVTR